MLEVSEAIVPLNKYSMITSAIAEYGHLMDGERFTLGELADAIRNATERTEQLVQLVTVLNEYGDSYIEDLVPNNKPGNNLSYREYITLPPEYQDFAYVAPGGEPPKSAGV